MNRETKTIALANGKQLIVKTYLTGREANEIKAEILKAAKMNVNSGEGNMSEISGEFLLKQERKLLEILIVSYNGESQALADTIENLPNAEYQEIIKIVNEVNRNSGLAERK